jgi:hypothetical protein
VFGTALWPVFLFTLLRQDVQADEDAFRQTEATERVKQAQRRHEQENIDRAREQNAKRKMDKIQSREWDSGKPVGGKKPVQKSAATDKEEESKDEDSGPPVNAASPPTSPTSGRGRGTFPRGSPRGRGRGRGRGGFNASAPAKPPSSNVTAGPAADDSAVAGSTGPVPQPEETKPETAPEIAS